MKQLRDPAWTLHRFHRVYLRVCLLLGIAMVARLLWHSSPSPDDLRLLGLWPVLLFGLLHVSSLSLPERRVNALYLRSFEADRSSIRLLDWIEAGLGPHFRLSGVSHPRRRFPVAARAFAFGVFVLRIASGLRLSLEAGADWKYRLAGSMGTARCVFLDLRSLSKSVEFEARLAHRVLGARRVLLLIDGELSQPLSSVLSCSEQEAAAYSHLNLDAEPDPHTVIHRTQDFVANLPTGFATICSTDLGELLPESPTPARQALWFVADFLSLVGGLALLLLPLLYLDSILAHVWLMILGIGVAAMVCSSCVGMTRLRRRALVMRPLNEVLASRLMRRWRTAVGFAIVFAFTVVVWFSILAPSSDEAGFGSV